MNRPNKECTLAEAAAMVKSGSSLSIGGFTSQRHPTALLRALVRGGVRDLHVYCHSAGSDVDLLIGAGCVASIEGAYLADGVFAPIAPNCRRFIESGRLEFEDYSNAAMAARFTAGATGLPCMPTLSMLGSDLLHRSGRRSRSATAKAVIGACPFSGRALVMVPAIRTDFCLLHVQKASTAGLLRIEGQEFLDVQQALAARTVIVTCEEIVDDAELRRSPALNRIPPMAVSAVVEVPGGAHPHAVYGYYDGDVEHLTAYGTAGRTEDSFQSWLSRFVLQPKTHAEYLEAIGGPDTLARLAHAWRDAQPARVVVAEGRAA